MYKKKVTDYETKLQLVTVSSLVITLCLLPLLIYLLSVNFVQFLLFLCSLSFLIYLSFSLIKSDLIKPITKIILLVIACFFFVQFYMLCNSSSEADQVITTFILGTAFAYAVPMLLGTADKYFISFLKRDCIDTEFEIDSYKAAEGGEIAVFNTDTERPHYARYVYWLLSFVLLITILLFIFFSVVSDFRDKGLYIVLVIVFSFALIYTLRKLKNFYD